MRWYDKDNGRELLAERQKGNQLQLFHDRPSLWDAWDLDPRYEQQPAGSPLLTRREAVLRGRVLDILQFRWEYGRSVIEQTVLLPKRGRRVDFQTKVLWQEDHKLLKVAFPVDVLAGKATYEIPFGALERPTHRNTSWDQAQYEVCGHRFADLSEHGYGVSLLNDCKYGYDIHGNVLRLSLLRAPSWPDRHADRGEHEFTYSLYPHAGDWREAQVVREAAALNAPLRPVAAPAGGGQAAYPPRQSWLDFRSGHVILETVKAAEDGSGRVLRLYESSGGRAEAVIGGLPEQARFFAANLLEEESGELHAENGTLRLTFRPFEVKTIKIRLGQDDKGRPDR
ncbi:glycoside hydrolase family 38 C-terminal domain-containing protein [Paenibacillus oralis]|uniref:glycoside hydrolase family 38 C-terminal domain-containing protein n=1 Tax=Paenibacillus oralis TaxID=2490856 RepID=UPI00319E43D7